MQDNKPEITESLSRVGVANLKTIVLTNWKGRKYNFVPEIELTVDLDRERKGVHMSRLVEAITECIEQEVEVRHGSLESVEKEILERLKARHPFKCAEITMRTDLVIQRKTPVTKKTTMETYGVEVKLISENGGYRKVLTTKVAGNTVCPHAMNECNGKTHIQRAIGILEVETAYENEIDLENMIDSVEESFPSRVYTLLKTEDEKKVVGDMFANPKFVEDVTRAILRNAKKRFANCRIRAKTISEESIHRHDVIAEGTVEN
jgi:GTP cyclohydrolase-4